jgi:hypothetical protein
LNLQDTPEKDRILEKSMKNTHPNSLLGNPPPEELLAARSSHSDPIIILSLHVFDN